MENEKLLRSNKVTAHFEGDGVIVASYYKTHDKLGQVKSTDNAVIVSGFRMPEPEMVDGKEVEPTPSQKLEAFRAFAQNNATAFGYVYDPIDRRPEGNKFPGKYDPASLLETAGNVLADGLKKLSVSAQTAIDTLVKQGAMPEGSTLGASIGVGNVEVTEEYKNGSLKYANVTFPVNFGINGKGLDTSVKVDLVSGQLKKPREIGNTVFTITGLKSILTEGGLLPVIEKKSKEEKSEDAVADVANGQCPDCPTDQV